MNQVSKNEEVITKQFVINDEIITCPIFKPGNRVKLKGAKNVTGTVQEVKNDGLLVRVKWDKEIYEDPNGSKAIFGSNRLACHIEYI